MGSAECVGAKIGRPTTGRVSAEDWEVLDVLGRSLAALGLSAEEENTYRALLAVPDSDLDGLSHALEITTDAVREPLKLLVERGLAKRVTDRRYAAVAPDSTLMDLLSDRLEQLRTGYEAFGELEQVYRNAQARNGVMPGCETIRGLEALRSRVMQLQEQSREQVCKLVRPPLITDDSTRIDSAADRGVEFRLVYERSMLEDPGVMQTVRGAADLGKQIRFASSLPVKLMIVDDRIALVSDYGEYEPITLATEHPSLIQLARGLFEQVWPTAVPAAGGDCPPLSGDGLADPDDRLLLSLLLAGLTDQAIAVRLGVGLRTVQRRVRDLMDAAGVDTRIQLGWQASRKGWVS